MCTTASNRLVRGKTFSLTPADCERDLYIRAKDACGTAESFLVIPCQVTNYYYDVNVALGEVAIGVVKTDNAEVNAILTAQKAKQAVVFNAANRCQNQIGSSLHRKPASALFQRIRHGSF